MWKCHFFIPIVFNRADLLVGFNEVQKMVVNFDIDTQDKIRTNLSSLFTSTKHKAITTYNKKI